MHEPTSHTTHLEDTPCGRLDDIIADYLAAAEAGNAPRREDLLAAYPDLAVEIAEFLDDQARLDAVVAPLVGHSPPNGIHSTTTLSLKPGQQVGRYELLEELGRGGMGVVYKARQKGVNRIVALKMIGAGVGATRADLGRFRLEAEAIAELDHPHIVPLYEIGEVDGQPYYCMKWIEDGSLADRMEDFPRQPREAVRLLLSVARAVDHAHQRGILHRDLKPANILLQKSEKRTERTVSEFEPFVSDFGLAKKLASTDSDGRMCTIPTAPTLSGTALGTPSYMAPEQARNARAATVAADVYSLGAILYECLTGRPPFRSSTSVETLLDVLGREPSAPSSVRPGITRDLDTICLKCLQKEPEKRYASAAALAGDLERTLKGEPILARPVGHIERALRWSRRQPLTAGLILAVAATVVIGIVLVFVQWQNAEANRANAEKREEEAESARTAAEISLGDAQRERTNADIQRKRAEKREKEAETARAAAESSLRDAQRERAEADSAYRHAHEAVNEFCVRLADEQLREYPTMLALRKQLLESGLKHYDNFLKRNENDPHLRREVADMHYRIARLTAIVGTKHEALVSCEKALAGYRRLLKETPNDISLDAELAWMLTFFAETQAGVGKTTPARESLKEAQEIWERLGRQKKDDPAVQRGLAAVRVQRGAIDGDEGVGSGDGSRIGEDLVALHRKLYHRSPEEPEQKGSLARALYNLGLSYNGSGRGTEALTVWTEAKKLQDELVDRHGDNPTHRRELTLTLRVLANWHVARNKFTEALPLYEKGRQLLVELTESSPAVLDYQRDLAAMHSDLGAAFNRNGRAEQGLAEMKLGLELRRKLVERRPGETTYAVGLAMSYHNLGNLHLQASRNAVALESYRKGEEEFRKLLKTNPDIPAYQDYLAGTLNNLGDALQKLGRSAEAIKAFEEALQLEKLALNRSPRRKGYRASIGMYSRNLARAYRLDKRPTDALALAEEQQKFWAGNGPELARVVREFVLVARMMPKDSPEQRRYLDSAIETLSHALAADFTDFDSLRKNPDLALLRQQEAFERLLQKHQPK